MSDTFIFTIPDYNNNIYETIENMLDELRNNSIFNINNDLGDTVQFNIEFEIIDENDIDNIEYFNNCHEINTKLSKPEKIKKSDLILDESCLICIDPYKCNQLKRTLPKCKHYFHKKCIDKWLKKKSNCPICRDLLK